MTAPDLTLDVVKKQAQTKVSRVSDFLTNDEKEERIKAKVSVKRPKRLYDAVDAYIAEIIARFGFEAYRAWQNGEIDEDKMSRLILAERAREKRSILPLEKIILASVAGSNQPTEHGRTPKSLKIAIKVLTEEQEKANG